MTRLTSCICIGKRATPYLTSQTVSYNQTLRADKDVPIEVGGRCVLRLAESSCDADVRRSTGRVCQVRPIAITLQSLSKTHRDCQSRESEIYWPVGGVRVRTQTCPRSSPYHSLPMRILSLLLGDRGRSNGSPESHSRTWDCSRGVFAAEQGPPYRKIRTFAEF